MAAIVRTNNITDDYELERNELGSGASGKVVIGTCRRNGVRRAIKQVPKYKYNIELLKTEIEVLSRLTHPGIVSLIEAFEAPRVFSFVLELCQGGELFDRIVARQHYSEQDAATIVRQMLTVIKYCHDNNIVHRDLKPDNFLFETRAEDSPLKLIDFGLAKLIKSQEIMREIRGTPYYIAPEVLNQSYNEKCDIWSIGVITYILLIGYPPFYAETDPGIYSKIRRGVYTFPDNIPVSDSAKDFIAHLLEMDVNKRFDAATALLHPWVTGASASSVNLKAAVDSLRNFNASCRLRNEMLQTMAHQLSNTDLEELRKQFLAMDLDGNGVITLNELAVAMAEHGADQSEIQRILKEVDVDGSGNIDYKEFLMAATQRKFIQQEEHLFEAFQRFDTNGDGFISIQELQSSLNYPPSELRQLEEMIREVDVNQDGRIAYEEFLEMFRSKGTLLSS